MENRYRESEYVELKEQYSDTIIKEVIAFANSGGGSIYVGVNDDGEIIGIDDADRLIQKIANTVRDAIAPDVTMFVSYKNLEQDNKTFLEIQVQRGTMIPYYLKSKGLRPVGVYVRQGTSAVPASDSAIREMIKSIDGDNFEEMRSIQQDLTFEYASDVFKRNNVEFGYMQMKSLGMIVEDMLYTNLALLFSDQCPHIIKAATFKGVGQEEFQDRYEFRGSILKQLDEAYAYLDYRNNLHGSYEGLVRIDIKDYPAIAIREALLNAIIHRDYGFSAPTIVGVYDDRMEFISFGGLVKGVCLNDVLNGASICRNPKLANIFYRLKLIEAYGTGLLKILNSYNDKIEKPDFKVTSATFKTVLPNVNYRNESSRDVLVDTACEEDSEYLSYIKEKGVVTRAMLQKKFGMSLSSANRALKQLVVKEFVDKIGSGKNTRYEIKK